MLHFGLTEIRLNHIFYYFNPKLYLLYFCWSLQSAFCCHMNNTTCNSDSSLILSHLFGFVLCYLFIWDDMTDLFTHLEKNEEMLGLIYQSFAAVVCKCFCRSIRTNLSFRGDVFFCPHLFTLELSERYSIDFNLVTPLKLKVTVNERLLSLECAKYSSNAAQPMQRIDYKNRHRITLPSFIGCHYFSPLYLIANIFWLNLFIVKQWYVLKHINGVLH